MRFKTKLIPAVVSALQLACVEYPLAQRSAGGPPGRLYDPASVETVRGEVAAVDTVTQGRRSPGVHLELTTASGPLTVRLGPAWYLEEEKLVLKVHDVIEITGSRVTVAGQPTLIAARVKQGDRTTTLRDASGVPLWQGRGRQGRGRP